MYAFIYNLSFNVFFWQWAEYLLFASLLIVVCVIFSIMAYFYTYIDPVAIEAEFKKKEGLDPDKEEKLEMNEKDSVQHDDEEEPRQTKMWMWRQNRKHTLFTVYCFVLTHT